MLRSVFVVFAIFVVAVYGEDPAIPKFELCSMQGWGYVKYTVDEDHQLGGDFQVKRVNETAIFHHSFPLRRDTGGILLIRPDLDMTYFTCEGMSWMEGSWAVEGAPRFSSYTYSGVENCTGYEEMKCHKFTITKSSSETVVAALFFREDDMTLDSEYYLLPENIGVTFIYEELQTNYEHEKIDGEFSTDAFGPESPAATNAPWTLSSDCPVDDPVFPWDKVCSMEGLGWMRYVINGVQREIVDGSFDVIRANGTALFSYGILMRSESGGVLALRPDLNKGFFSIGGTSRDGEVELPSAPMLYDYEYMGTFECGWNRDRMCYFFGIPTKDGKTYASMAFSPRGLRLVEENFPIDGLDSSIRFIYRSVFKYEHNEIDGAFSTNEFGEESPAATEAQWALTSGCDVRPEPSSFEPQSPSSEPQSPEPTSSTPGSSLEPMDPSSGSVFVPSFVAVALVAIAFTLF